MAVTATKKLEQLNQKISSLRQEQQKVQDQLAQEFLDAIKHTQALTLDFPTLIGGLLEVISKIQSSTSEVEGWRQAGGKFLRSLSKVQSVKSADLAEKAA